VKTINNLVRIYRDTAGQLCAVESGTGKVWSLTPHEEIGEVGQQALKFVGKLSVNTPQLAADVPDEVA
jgi:hypothetical protein